MALLTTEVWEVSEGDFPAEGGLEAQLRFLLRYAILAPSVKNTQPWIFKVGGDTIRVYADLERRLAVSDPDCRELFISVGCAIENLLVAAEYFGFRFDVSYFPQGDQDELVASIVLAATGTRLFSAPRGAIRFDALVRRHNDNGAYRPDEVRPVLREQLQACAAEPDLRLDLSDDRLFRRWVDELTTEADRIEFANPKFRQELGRLIGTGAFGAGGLMSRVARLLVSRLDIGDSIAQQDRAIIESAPILGLVLATGDSRLVHVRAGQLFERVWLLATSMGLSVHPMSQTMRIPELRTAVAELLPEGGWMPQHLFRLGYSAREGRPRLTPRRPVTDVLGT
jgi:nitroreductase